MLLEFTLGNLTPDKVPKEFLNVEMGQQWQKLLARDNPVRIDARTAGKRCQFAPDTTSRRLVLVKDGHVCLKKLQSSGPRDLHRRKQAKRVGLSAAGWLQPSLVARQALLKAVPPKLVPPKLVPP